MEVVLEEPFYLKLLMILIHKSSERQSKSQSRAGLGLGPDPTQPKAPQAIFFAKKGAQALAHTNWDPSPMYERQIFLFLVAELCCQE